MANRTWDNERGALIRALKNLRTVRGLTQVELAEMLQKPQSYVSKYESGERKLDFVEVMSVCAALETKPAALIELYEKLLGSSSKR